MSIVTVDYFYKGVVTEVRDGDTLTINADLGFNTWHLSPFRLLGCNARELSQPGGPEAKANLESLVLGKTVTIKSVKPDKYGERYLAKIWIHETDGFTTDLVDKLIEEKWAAEWDGRGEKPLPPWPREL